jgi:hypothetical protein
VSWLVKQTMPCDWEQGSRPIAWPSARRQEEFLGLSDARVKAQIVRGERIRALITQPRLSALRLVDEVALLAALDAGVFDPLPVEVITAPSLRLDTPTDRHRLSDTVQNLQPVLLILDPLIRLHRVDENDATQIATLLSYLRELQRQFQLAILLVHHARKDSNGSRPGQALRGSSELHGWGDSNLYLRRKGEQLTLSTEHSAAASQNHIPLQLTQVGSALALAVLENPLCQPKAEPTPVERVRAALAQLQEPVFSVQQLRKLCAIRTETLCAALEELTQQGELSRNAKGYQLNLSFPVSRPIDPQGNGNGKRSDFVQ